jgi:hypothetical protein
VLAAIYTGNGEESWCNSPSGVRVHDADWPRPRDDQTANMEARRTAPRGHVIDVLTIYSAVGNIRGPRASALRFLIAYKVHTVARLACDEGYLQPLQTSFALDGPARLILNRDNETCPGEMKVPRRHDLARCHERFSLGELPIAKFEIEWFDSFSPNLRHAFLQLQIGFWKLDRRSREKGDFELERKLGQNSFTYSVP